MSAAALREGFPITERYAYFNHAAVSPLPLKTATAMRSHLAEATRSGIHAYGDWIDAYRRLRAEAAKILHCEPAEIAITKNTSEGLSAVANGLDWRPDDVIVGLQDDFPANYVPWRALVERQGVQFRSLALRHGRLDLDELDRACRGARLAALSYVHFLTGFRWDLSKVGEICRRRDCLLVVDAVQGMGALPIDVKSADIHALSASAHKWLLGPEGCAVFYVDNDWMPSLAPSEIGWTSVAGWENYLSDGDLLPTASRFECGTLNTVGSVGMAASLELLNSVPPEVREDAVHSLVERLLEGARAKGYAPAAERTRECGSGIVSLRKPGVDPVRTAEALLAEGISVAERLGWLRVAPHFYNNAEEIDRLVDRLP